MTQEQLKQEIRDIENNSPSPSETCNDLVELINRHVKEVVKAELVEYILPRVEKFIRKVETGRARSVETYQDMKDVEAKLIAFAEKESKE